VNDAAVSTMLSYARGTDLDHKAADYGVSRLLMSPADPDAYPPVEAVYEDDERLRYRAQMALEGLSVAGSRGAYLFHCLSASALVADASIDAPVFAELPISDAIRGQLPADALILTCTYDAGLQQPFPGDVSVTVLPVDAGVDEAVLTGAVQKSLSADDVRPLTDRPRVQAGKATSFQVSATIELENGPASQSVLATAQNRLDAVLVSARKLGGTMSRSAIFAALHIAGVRRVTLVEPAADIRCDARHFPKCDGTKLEVA
jgi:phage-related baseplate assembly protein